jgi:FKBP-type peptidyl-prolyl cis-trans isomerase FkpA
MNRLYTTIFSLFLIIYANAGHRDSILVYPLPDSVKAIQLVATINFPSMEGIKNVKTGIQTAAAVEMYLEKRKKKHAIVFAFPVTASIITKGLDVKPDVGRLEWNFPWTSGPSYRLLIAQAPDSAGNFVLYSGYAWIPSLNKWKLIGTCRINGQWGSIREPASFVKSYDDKIILPAITDVWIQRSNNSWKKLQGENNSFTSVNVLSHVDSLQQFEEDRKIILAAIKRGKTDALKDTLGIFYKILEPGTGHAITATDTVTVFYRLTLLGDTATIDQTGDKPAVFPLARLIKAWQIGIPLIRTGGRIRLVIPSMHAYSIRTRSPKIPPNSILDFSIHVLDAKSPKP